METKDVISGVVGILIFLLGLELVLERYSLLNLGISNELLKDSLAAAAIVILVGAYLFYESIIELANSNIFGWPSAFIGFLSFIAGVLLALTALGINLGLNPNMLLNYQIVFILQGVFLIIAMYAMEP